MNQKTSGEKMNYIVFDLEWNQSHIGQAGEHPRMPFEIIEIGAFKLNKKYETIGEFRRLVCPKLYPKLHRYIKEILNYDEEDLKSKGVDFKSACTDFLEWCKEDLPEGEEYRFCTWGVADLNCLQNNMDFYKMEKLPFPLRYYDIQQIFSEKYLKDGKVCKLEKAVERLKLKQERPYHAAISDAFYTSMIIQKGHLGKFEDKYIFDMYRHPKEASDEIMDYHNGIIDQITIDYPSKKDAMKNQDVNRVYCPKCGRITTGRIKWFHLNNGSQVAVGKCLRHGNMMATIKFKPSSVSSSNVFVVKKIEPIKKKKYKEVLFKRDRLLEKRKIIKDPS